MSDGKFGLARSTREKILSVIPGKPRVERVILYGSRAMGNFKIGSDIDLTLAAPSLTTTDLLTIQTALDDLLLPYKIDLSLLHQIDNLGLLEHIRRVGTEFLA